MDILQILLVLPPLLSTQSTSTFQGDVTADPIALTSTTSTRKASTSTSGSQTPGPSSKPAVEEEWAHVEAYLYSGNASLLSLAKCTQTYHLSGLQGSQAVLGPFLHQALDALTNAANFLNMIFQANDLRESSIREDMEWYHALVRGLMEGDPLIRRALFTFDTEPTALQPQLVLQASRPSYKSQDILLQDMSSAWERLHPPAPAPHISWYTAFKFSAQLAPTLSKRVLLNDLHTLDTPKWGRGDSYVTSQNGVHWADPPFLECDNRHFLPGWLLTLSTPFYGLKPDLSPEFRGVIRIDVNLQSFDVDQCAEGNDWFFNTHQCNRSSMHCEHIRGRGFRLGQYRCHCKEGFYSPLPATPDARVQEKRNGNGSGSSPPALPLCLPCWPGCKQCKDGAPCKVQEDWYLRAAVLTVQGFFMLLVLISMLVAYQFRRNKRIRASGLVLLETILFGSLLLYFPVFILYFKPSTFRCILLRWVRLLGFAIVYGTVTLKMYRVLKVFLSRTAHRVPYMSSTRLLKMLGVVVLTVCWFLTAWTAGALQNRDRSIPLVVSASTRQGQAFTQCDLDRWDYMMAIAEMLFLCWGSSLCSAVRMVPSAFHEPRYMSIAIHNELLVSSLFHVLRFFKPFLHPDWTLLLFFMHTHITVTVTVALLFIPKFLHVSRPLREEIAAEVYEDEVDLRRSCSYFTSSFASAWNEHNFEPDDIRDELKKLYTQLEVHKTKKMTDNNPHLPKKRSSRLGLGQSIIKRITKIPESMSRQCSREEKDVSLCGRTGSKQSSCIKRGLESASIKSSEESFNQCALLLHKSHSTYDYSKDRQSHFVDPRDVSLLDSLMRRKLAKAAFERSEIKSVDAVPFVYKSASAHNLSVDQQLLQPEPKKLQKSLSVMTSNKEGSHEQAGKSCNVEQTLDVSRAKKQDSQSRLGASISSQTLNALLSESFDKAEVCPWELEDHLPEGKSQKHVTYATGSCRSQRTLERTDSPAVQQCHLGPWDTLTMDYSVESTVRVKEEGISNNKKTTEDKHGGAEASDSDSESIKPQVPLSSSAPHSPVTGVGKQKEQRVFSFYGRPGLSMKGFMRSGKGSRTDKNKKGLQVMGKSKETMCEENIGFHPDTIRIPYPRMESVGVLLNDGIKDNLVLQTQQTSITDTFLRECKETKRTKRKGSLQIDMDLPEKNMLENKTRNKDNIYENIFPWETLNLDGLRKQNSLRANICPWEMDEEKKVPFKDSQDITKGQKPSIGKISKHQSMFSQKITNTEVCPWDISEASEQLPIGHQGNFADICPWEVEDTSSSSMVMNSARFPEEIKEIEKTQWKEGLPANVCPSQEEKMVRHRSEDRSSVTNEVRGISQNQDGLKKEDPNKTTYSTKKTVDETTMKVEICPWDVVSAYIPQTNQSSIEDICPWDVKILEKEKKAQEGVLSEICPWETAEPERTFRQSEICPWEDKGSDITDSKKTDELKCTNSPQRMDNETPNIQSFVAEVCPWDVIASTQEKTQRMPTVIAEVCPWDVNQSDSPHVQLEASEPSPEGLKVMESTAEKQKSPMLWNTETDEGEKMTKMQDVSAISGQSCPLELETCQAEGKREHERNRGSLISMGESPNDSTVPRQTSITVEPCPWRFPEMSVNMQEICPWVSMSAKPSLVKQTAIQLSSEEPEAADTKEETTFVSNCSVTAKTASPDIQTTEKQDKTKGRSGVGQGLAPLATKESEGTTVRHAGTDTNEHPLERVEVTSSGELPLGFGTQSSAAAVPMLETATTETKSSKSSHEAGEAQPEHPAAYCDSFNPWHEQEVKRSLIFPHSAPWEGENTTNDAESEAEAFYFPPEL